MASTGIDIGQLWPSDYEIGGIVLEGRIYSKLSPQVVAKWTLVVMGMTAGRRPSTPPCAAPA